CVLQRILDLRPNALEAHQMMAQLYWEMGYFDLAVEHGRRANVLLRSLPRPADQEELHKFEANLNADEQVISARENFVKQLRTAYDLAAAHLPAVHKAARAFVLFGLPKQALEQFAQAKAAGTQFGRDEVELYVYLLLTTGQVEALQSNPLGK